MVIGVSVRNRRAPQPHNRDGPAHVIRDVSVMGTFFAPEDRLIFSDQNALS